MQAHLGNLRDAFIDYERALQIDGNLPIVYLNRGLLYQQIGEVEKSKKDYQQVFAIAPEVAMASYSKGLAPMTLAQSPALVSIHLERALAHGNLDQIDLALKDIEQALAVDANAESAYLLRGNLYYARKEWSKALADYNQVLKLDPDHANALYNRAWTKYKMGNKKEAIADFQTVATLYQQQGKTEEETKVRQLIERLTKQED